MNWYFVITIAFALAIDAFTVAVASATYLGQMTARQKFRLSFHFGFFQFLMPLIGWLAVQLLCAILRLTITGLRFSF